MGSVTAWVLLSLDGVMEAPEEWANAFHDDEITEASASGMTDSDALLLGRVTYEELSSYWPDQPADDPMAEYINTIPKYVVSTTLDEPLAWTNSTLVTGAGTDDLTELRQRSDQNFTVIGSGTLVRSLLRDGLLDELQVLIHPLILGDGKRLFEAETDRVDLELVDSRTFRTGIVSHTYRPARTEETA